MINHNHNRINKEIEVIEVIKVIVVIEEEERIIVIQQVIKIMKMFILIYDRLFFNSIYLCITYDCIFFILFKFLS